MEEKSELFQCTRCHKSFGYHRNLKAHVKICSNSKSIKEKGIKCPDSNCGHFLARSKLLKDHVANYHKITLQEEKYYFSDANAFRKWKLDVEKENLCFYSCRATATLKDNTKRTYYDCHRSGYFESRSQGKRRIKSQGSNRINSTCTSTLVVTESTDGINVDFCSTHFGHGSNLGRCCLTPDERSMIAGKIAQGVAFPKILDQFRDNVENMYDPKTLISKKDLYNIERDFNIEGKALSDYVSVRLWLEKMNGDVQNPVLYSNLENDDIFLIISTEFQLEMLKKFGSDKICVDSTHGTTEYETYLTTIVVVDEFGNGFPTCFCFTRGKDTDTWITFFSKVRDRIGSLKPTVFMTDDDPAFYNAWCTVMGPPDKKLLCSWHVDQAWRKKIMSKINGTIEKKTYVYKTLKILQHEPNVADFENLLEKVCQALKEDNETKEFFCYFQSTYLRRVEQWAYCHRHLCGINTNMYLESIHKTLKYYYLKGRKNKRLDICINALLKFIRDKSFDRFIKLAKNKYSAKEENVKRSHQAAVTNSGLKIECVSPTSWRVESATFRNKCYEVHKVRQICDEENCHLKCRPCDICNHIFHCECPDFIIRSNICKHIHSIVLLNGTDQTRQEHPDPARLEFEIENLEKALVNHEEKDEDEENMSAIADKLMVAVGLSKTNVIPKEKVAGVHRKIDSILDDLRGSKRKLIETTNINVEPATKKIEKQPRFSSSKKQNRIAKIQSQTSTREAMELKNCFISSTEMLAISSAASNDHLY